MADKIMCALIFVAFLGVLSAFGVMLIGMAFPKTFRAIDEKIEEWIRGDKKNDNER